MGIGNLIVVRYVYEGNIQALPGQAVIRPEVPGPFQERTSVARMLGAPFAHHHMTVMPKGMESFTQSRTDL